MNMKEIIMNRGSTFLLRGAIIAIGVAVLALCIFALPPTWQAVPGEYPEITYVFYCILTAMYISAVPFFLVLHQTMRLLGYIDQNKVFSELSVSALKRIKYCAGLISVIYASILPFLYIWAQHDDAPGLIVMGMIVSGAAFAVGVFAAVLQRLLRQAIDIKSENDLTV